MHALHVAQDGTVYAGGTFTSYTTVYQTGTCSIQNGSSWSYPPTYSTYTSTGLSRFAAVQSSGISSPSAFTTTTPPQILSFPSSSAAVSSIKSTSDGRIVLAGDFETVLPFATDRSSSGTLPPLESNPSAAILRVGGAGFFFNDASFLSPLSTSTTMRHVLVSTSEIANTAADTAASLARAYTQNRSDWFLPSRLELNELCKYARGQSMGQWSDTECTNSGSLLPGFSSGVYWSSTEFSASAVDTYDFSASATKYANSAKSSSGAVRPIRAGGVR